MIESGFDLVGTGMFEFDEGGRILGKRTPPTDEADIKATARFHDPFNHPTVVYRRSAVARAGGYRELALMEDYWLFARMILTGAEVANIADPLLMYRVDAGAYSRRGRLEAVSQRNCAATSAAPRRIRYTATIRTPTSSSGAVTVLFPWVCVASHTAVSSSETTWTRAPRPAARGGILARSGGEKRGFARSHTGGPVGRLRILRSGDSPIAPFRIAVGGLAGESIRWDQTTSLPDPCRVGGGCCASSPCSPVAPFSGPASLHSGPRPSLGPPTEATSTRALSSATRCSTTRRQ